jgi:hypothetical protein
LGSSFLHAQMVLHLLVLVQSCVFTRKIYIVLRLGYAFFPRLPLLDPVEITWIQIRQVNDLLVLLVP